MTNWKPIETIPKDRWVLARKNNCIYKCKYYWYDEDTNTTHYESLCGQPLVYTCEPEEWCEIPE